MILLEFDPQTEAYINAWDEVEPIPQFPEVCVSCFAFPTFNRLLEQFSSEIITFIRYANLHVPVYKIQYQGMSIALVNAYVGAAGCVAMFEDIAALGAKHIVLFGTCGVLSSEIQGLSIIIPNAAVRDEGTSYHYAPASDEIVVPSAVVQQLTDFFAAKSVSYAVGKTWTTDAIYRETAAKVATRKAQGCICVEMECAAMQAFAALRKIELYQFFYAADRLDATVWNEGHLKNSTNLEAKDYIAALALQFAYQLINKGGMGAT